MTLSLSAVSSVVRRRRLCEYCLRQVIVMLDDTGGSTDCGSMYRPRGFTTAAVGNSIPAGSRWAGSCERTTWAPYGTYERRRFT